MLMPRNFLTRTKGSCRLFLFQTTHQDIKKAKQNKPPHYLLESSIQPIHSTMSVVLLKPVTIKIGTSDTYISAIITVFQAQRTLPVVFYIWRRIKLRTIFSASVRTLQLKERKIFTSEGQESENLSRKIVSK